MWKFRSLAIATGLVCGGCLGGLLWGSYLAFGPSASDRTARDFAQLYDRLPDPSRKLLDAAGYGPADRIVCSANLDGSLVFSGHVMRRDDQRGYRFKERQANLWIFPAGLPNQILVPYTTEVRSLIEEAGLTITSREEINSYGCRGPEWGNIEDYDHRILVVGDSFTEGILVAEEQTFCAQLEAQLQERTGSRVLVANSGVIGYSTEQEFHTMTELAPKLQPDLIVLCFFANDVHHNHLKVLNTDGYDAEWQAVNGWLERCITFCRKLGVGFAVAVVPNRSQLGLRTSRKRYQHRLEQLTLPLGIYLIDPDERFLSHRREPLFLFADDHFAPAGHALFAQVLTDHIMVWAGSK